MQSNTYALKINDTQIDDDNDDDVLYTGVALLSASARADSVG